MTEPEVDALDRDLDLLALQGSVSTDGPDRPDVLGLLAMVRAVDWPDRAAGQRVAGAVASKLAVQSVVPAAVSHAHPNGTSEPGAEVTQTVDWWSRMTAEP